MKVGICGHYGMNKPFFDGQTVKTKIYYIPNRKRNWKRKRFMY